MAGKLKQCHSKCIWQIVFSFCCTVPPWRKASVWNGKKELEAKKDPRVCFSSRLKTGEREVDDKEMGGKKGRRHLVMSSFLFFLAFLLFCFSLSLFLPS